MVFHCHGDGTPTVAPYRDFGQVLAAKQIALVQGTTDLTTEGETQLHAVMGYPCATWRWVRHSVMIAFMVGTRHCDITSHIVGSSKKLSFNHRVGSCRIGRLLVPSFNFKDAVVP